MEGWKKGRLEEANSQTRKKSRPGGGLDSWDFAFYTPVAPLGLGFFGVSGFYTPSAVGSCVF